MTSQSKKPTHIINHVVKDGEYTRSQRIGVLWQHTDGVGFNIDLDYLPFKQEGFMSARPFQSEDSQD